MADDIEVMNGDTPEGPEGGVLMIDIEDEMRRSYLGYAVSTLIARALPDGDGAVGVSEQPIQTSVPRARKRADVGERRVVECTGPPERVRQPRAHPHGQASNICRRRPVSSDAGHHGRPATKQAPGARTRR